MNVQAPISRPQSVKLGADDFRLLRRSGAFAAYSRSELLEGELWGTLPRDEDEEECDAKIPIKLRIEDYFRLHEAGAFDRYGKTELIDGVVYAMNPQYRPHSFVKNELAYRMRRVLEAIGSALYVGTEASVVVSDTDLPQPDIFITDEPRGEGPVPRASVRLLAEVADSSLDFDLSHKSALYAANSIAECWIVDVKSQVIHQMWAPEGSAYTERREVRFGERIEAATIAGLAVSTVGLV